MTISRPLQFVLKMTRLDSDIGRVAHLMTNRYAYDMLLDNKIMMTHSFEMQSMLLRQFPLLFRGMIEAAAKIQNKDFFGNSFHGYDSYDFIEIITSYDYRFLSSIRFLGTKNGESIRYSIYGLPNIIFDPSTLNILSDIHAISDSIDNFFSKVFNLFCVPGLSFADDVSHLKDMFTGNKGDNLNLTLAGLSTDVISSIGWFQFVNSYFVPTPIIVKRSSLTKEALEAIESKFNKPFKNLSEIASENGIFGGLKSDIANLTSKSFEINSSSKFAFFSDLESQIKTLSGLYSNVFDVFTLGCLISEVLECIRPPISCPDILRELPPNVLRTRISLAFVTNPSAILAANKIIDRVLQETIDNKLDPSTESDRILDDIATIIDVEEICNLQIPFDIPKLTLPFPLPTIDLMMDFSIQFDAAILKALIDALIEMILGILRDLLSCGKLTNFIEGLMNGKIADDSGAYGDLAKLFTDPEDLGRNSNIANSLGNRWDNFANQVSPMMNKLIDFNMTGSVGTEQFSFNRVVSGEAGLNGMKKVLTNGDFSSLESSVKITKNEKFVAVDVTDLEKNNSVASKQFLKEVSAWELSSDQEHFTLGSLSEDKVAVISSVSMVPDSSSLLQASPQTSQSLVVDEIRDGSNFIEADEQQTFQRIRLEKISGEEIVDEFGKLFDSISSLLNPSETINLLAGKASIDTLKTVLEIAKIKHKRLFVFFSTQQQISSLFEMFGKTVGFDTLRDKLLLLTASAKANKSLYNADVCAPFDDILDFRKNLLRKTLPEDQVIKITENVIKHNKQRFNDIQDGLVKIKNGISPIEILKPILCNTGKGSDNKMLPVVSDSLDSTIDLMFEPTRMMFDREVVKYVDAISVTNEHSVEIPRHASNDNSLPIFNPTATDGNIFSPLSSVLKSLGIDLPSEGEDETRINPEFKKMVSGGFVPVKKDGKSFTPDGDPNKDYINGEEPVYKKNTKRKTAAAFKEGIKLSNKDIDIDLNKKFKISFRGSLDEQSPVSSFTPFKIQSPEWIIEYVEKDGVLFNIRSNGQLQTSAYGILPFSDNYKIQKDEIVVDEELRSEILKISNSSTIQPRQNVFNKMFSSKVLPILEGERQKASFNAMFKDNFENFMRSTIREIGSGFSRNRLLKKVKNNSLSSLAPNGMALGDANVEDLIALNLINFSPTPTNEQRECNTDPHLLDFEFVKKIVKENFDKSCNDKNNDSSIDGQSAKRGPLNSSGLVGVVLTLVRLYCIEYIMRSLFVLDEFRFNKDFSNDDLLIDYITFRMQSDLTRLEMYDDFEKEALIAYDTLIENGTIPTYSNDINACASNDSKEFSIKIELKAIVKSQMETSMKRVSDILGIDTKKEVSMKTVFFDGLDIYDTFSDFGATHTSDYTPNNFRFDGVEIPTSGKFILEKYIRIPKQSEVTLEQQEIYREVIRLEQQNLGAVNDIVNFKNWEEFIHKIVVGNSLLSLQNKKIYDPKDLKNSLFNQPWKVGLRLVYIPESFGEPIDRDHLLTNQFKIKDSQTPNGFVFSIIDTKTVSDSKAYYIFDTQKRSQQGEAATFKQYNPVPIVSKEVELTDFINLGDINRTGILSQVFESKYRKILFKQMFEDKEVEVLIDYCLFSKRMLSLFVIHSTMILNNEPMKFLFEGTKLELKKLFYSMKTMGDYLHKTSFKKLGKNAGEFQRKFNRVGSPNGPAGADAFYFWSTTPIHILKSLAILTDPNIYWADKIVATAASGFLAPRLKRVGTSVRIKDTKTFVNSTPGIILSDNFEVLITGEVVKLKKKKDEVGVPFIDYSLVALIKSNVDGKVTLEEESYPDGSKGPAIRSGLGFRGVPWSPAGNGPDFGIDLDNFNSFFNEKDSVPIYPGEKINLPYGLASMALTPLQIFALMLGPACRTMYNPILPFGTEFLTLEPLIYQFPYYQIAAAETSVADDVLEDGIDLKGASKIKCDEKQPSETNSDGEQKDCLDTGESIVNRGEK